MIKNKLLYIIIFFIPIIIFSQESTLQVLNRWKLYNNKENALYQFYSEQAFHLLNERAKDISKLKSKTDWLKRQKRIKRKLKNIIGKFPEKTPLNAKVLGVSEKKDYKVEKIVFESQPNFYVTAALYIPKDLKEKAPAILYTIGHAQNAFRRKRYQTSAINFVKKGFIVLTFDPIGQGERVQYYSPKLGKSEIGGTVREHIYVGLQTLLVGKSLTNYFTFDGIRALDYLLSRKGVDPERIGITGLSGGGTQTTFISAFDDRIYAAAPSCYITSYKRLFESIGPQDAEQNLYLGLANKIDFADFLEIRIPKPELVVTTTRDFFSIQGARETENEVGKVYKIFGAAENFGHAEADSTHSMPTPNREARHRFFQKFLKLPGNPKEEKVEYLDKELQITETGQVSTSLGGETVFSLNKKEAEKEISIIKKSRIDFEKHKQNIINAAEKLSGYVKPLVLNDVVFRGRYNLNGFSIERYFITGEGNYPIPFLVYIPQKVSASTILYFNQEGKSKPDKIRNNISDEMREDILGLVKQGHVVLAADLLGTGEMKQKSSGWLKYGKNYGELDYSNYFASVQLGKSLVGIQASDIQRLVLFVKQADWFNGKEIDAIARGKQVATALLYSAAIEKNFSKIVLVKPLISYASIVLNKFYYCDGMPPFVPAALTAYDLPDLEASLNPAKLLMINVQNHLNQTANERTINSELGFVRNTFTANNLRIEKINSEEKIINSILSWCKN